MANSYESTIDELMNELKDLNESSIQAAENGCPLSKSQINVLSTDFDKIVINFDLNPNNESNNSSIVDKNDGNGNDFNDNEKHHKSRTLNNSSSDSNPKVQSSANDSENTTKINSDQKLNQLSYVRSIRRTISESCNEVTTRGILKYPHNWMRRTVSESSCDFAITDLDHYSDNYGSIEESYSEDDLYSDDNKPKKNVRFSDHVSKTVFRATSSILGRKSKNKKRAKNRKNSKNNEPNQRQPNSTDLSSEPIKSETNDNSLESQRSRQDSGYDSEDIGHDSEDIGHEDSKFDNFSHNKAYKKIDCIQMETGINSQSFE